MDRYETAAREIDDQIGVHPTVRADLTKFLREHFPEPGRCGECHHWQRKGRCGNIDNVTDTFTPWTNADFSCPRFEPRPDEYEELAREFYEPRHPRFTTELAAFLRERVTVRET